MIKALGIKKHKKQKIPDRTDEQKADNGTKCSALYRKYWDREFFLDDECYFTKTKTKTPSLYCYFPTWGFCAIYSAKWLRG